MPPSCNRRRHQGRQPAKCSTAGAKRKIEEIMAKGDRLAPFPDFVDEDEDEYGECSCSCGFGKEHEKLFRYLMQVMVILKVVDENMEALYRKQMEIKELLALITSLQTKLASVKPQLTFIEMEGAKYCERMDDFKTGALLLQVSKDYSTSVEALELWENQMKHVLGNIDKGRIKAKCACSCDISVEAVFK